MKVFGRGKNQNDLFKLLPHAIAKPKKNIIDPFFGDNEDGKYANQRPPLRAEIFTREKMEQYAVTLAKRHVLITRQTPEQLLKRLAENEHILLEVHSLLTKELKENNHIAPAGEWLQCCVFDRSHFESVFFNKYRST